MGDVGRVGFGGGRGRDHLADMGVGGIGSILGTWGGVSS